MKLKYWIYIEKEISDLTDIFSKLFNVSDFHRDYENVWEWIEGQSDKLNAEINISRKHNWESGLYDKPLRIQFNFSNGKNSSKIDELGMLIAKELKTETFYGEINHLKGTECEYIEMNKFHY